MTEPIPGYDSWKTRIPESDCPECDDAGCDDGEIVGRGSLGEDTYEKCYCGCHEDPEALEEMYSTR